MKPSRSLRPNHSWLRNFFVVMGGELRAAGGAKYFVERPLRNESVYPRASRALVKIFLERCVLADYLVAIVQRRKSAARPYPFCVRAKRNPAMISQNESSDSIRKSVAGGGGWGILTRGRRANQGFSWEQESIEWVHIPERFAAWLFSECC
jgi:hypothetical protein